MRDSQNMHCTTWADCISMLVHTYVQLQSAVTVTVTVTSATRTIRSKWLMCGLLASWFIMRISSSEYMLAQSSVC